MIETLVIEGENGDQTFPPERCPLIAGGSIRSALRLPGAGPQHEPLLFGLSAGQAFVQPGPGRTLIQCNGEPVTVSQWLRDGDLITVGETELRCHVQGSCLRLQLGRVPEIADTLPPLESKPPAEELGIMPEAFDRPGGQSRRNSVRFNLVPALVVLVFLALAAVAWYTFTARSVLIELKPVAEELKVEGALLPVRLGDRFLLRPGEYRVLARLAGHFPLDESLVVSAEGDQAAVFRFSKLPGRVTIDTPGVSQAQVQLNGEPVGATPLVDLEVPAGPNSVAVQAPRYLEYRDQLEVLGKGQRQSLEVRLVPDWAEVSVSSNPAEARLLVDGLETGTTPESLELRSGTHELTLQLAGYDDWTARVEAVANETLAIGPVTLVKSRALLSLSSQPAGALVQLDGVFKGRTPMELALVPDRSHELLLSRSGFQPVRESVLLESGQRQALELRLRVILGTLRIAADPADAELWVDGVARGKASQQLRLSAVPHRIEIRKPGYVPYQTTVTPKPGLEQEVGVKLSKAGAGGRGGATRSVGRVQTPDGQTLVYVGPGRFTMGASRREQGRRSNETLREVELTRPYYMAMREVSNGQIRRFDPSHQSGNHAGHSLDVDAHPAVNVSWDQAARYCNWLSNRESLPPAYRDQGGRMVTVLPPTRGYRLPTEAEWAWAARGGSAGRAPRYPWGESWPPPPGSGNYADRSAASELPGTLQGYEDGFPVTAPLGSFPPGKSGFMDMGGNVSEWVQDVYSIYSAGALQRDPLGPAGGRHHVIRGSSWRDGGISALRLSYRDYGDAGSDEVGFRVARYAD